MLPLPLLHSLLLLTLPLLPNAFAQSTSPLPRIDFSRMGTVGIAGAFAGLSLFSPNTSSPDPLASTLLSLSPATSSSGLSELGATNEGGQILAVCELGNLLYVAGAFGAIGGKQAQNVAVYEPSTSTFSALQGGGVNGPVYALYCDSTNNVLWLGGAFTSPSSSSSSYGGAVALYSPSTSTFSPPPFYGLSGSVHSISLSPSSSLYFAGSFITSFESNTTNTHGNNPSVPYSPGASPYSSSLVPVSLPLSSITAEPSTTQAGFTDIASILCPAGADGAGNTWLAQDGEVAQITVRLYRNEGVSGVRLGNTFVQGRGTTGFTLTTIPDNAVLPLTYLDPLTNTSLTCGQSSTTPCPLLTNASIPYQDFLFASSPALTITGFQLTLDTFQGAGAGLHILQLLSSGAAASFVESLNEPASCFAPGPSTVTQSGTWTEQNITTSTAGTLQPILTTTFPTSTSPSSAPSLNLSIYTSAVGLYTAYMLIPGCTEMQDCGLRTTVQVTLSPGGGQPPWTQEVDQRVETDTLTQIYRGALYPSAPSYLIPVSLTLSPSPQGTGQGGMWDIVADEVMFVLTAAPGLSGEGSVGEGVPGYNATGLGEGVQMGWGVFEWPLSGGAQVNATAMLGNGTETAVDRAGAALYTALTGSSTSASLSSFGTSMITALASPNSNTLLLAGSFALPSLSISNIALWNGTSLLALLGGGLNGAVSAMALDSTAGVVYVGGNFTDTAQGGSGLGLSGVASYNVGKNEWAGMSGGVAGPVLSLALNGTSLSVAGNFTTPSPGLALWSTSSTSWSAPAGFLVGNMSVVTAPANVSAPLYLAGNVRATAGFAAEGWALLSQDGAGEPAIQPVSGAQFAAPSASPATGGSSSAPPTRRTPFLKPMVRPRSHLSWLRRLFTLHARQATSPSTTPSPLPTSPPSPAPAVLAGTFYQNSSSQIIVLGGNFSLPSSSSASSSLALYDTSSGSVRALNGPALNGTVRCLLVSGSTLFVGGEFGQVGEVTDGLGMYDLGAGQWITAFQALQPMSGSTSVSVRSLSVVPSSPATVIVAGSFASAGGLACQGICAWDTSGKQWNTVGEGIRGEVAAVDYAGSGSSLLIAAGSLATAEGAAASVLEYNIANSTWSVIGTGSDIPGPATAMTVDNYNQSSIFVAGMTTGSSTPFLSHWDGVHWTSVDGTLQSPSIISQLELVPLLDSHATNDMIESNRMLLVSGTLASSTFGTVSTALFDGQDWHPYLVATTATGTTGAISSLFYSASNINLFSATNFMAAGLVILISIVIAAAIVLAIFLIGLLIGIFSRRSDNSHHLIQNEKVADDDASSVRPSSLLEHVQAATRATIFGAGAFGAAGQGKRSTETTPDGLGEDEHYEHQQQQQQGVGAGGEDARTMHARYSFEAEGEGELPIRAGAEVQVLDDQDTSWWYARDLSSGREGVVPAAYLY